MPLREGLQKLAQYWHILSDCDSPELYVGQVGFVIRGGSLSREQTKDPE
jgi:hypothetical protein